NTKLVACVGYGYGYGYFPFPPLVTGVVPNNGPSTGGTTVTITGLGFCNFPSGVTFGGVPATGFVVNSDTSATAVSPAHAPGVVHVQVTTAGGTSNPTTLDQFTYGAFTSYFTWFDKASTGFLHDNIHLLNPGATPSTVAVSVQGGTPVVAVVQPGGSTYVTFPFGIIGGPVKIQVTAGPAVLASQRVQFQNTFNEVWASSAALASGSSFVN